ncbi:hypothetical protein U0868_00165 [Kluyvera ascorbata]|uniref:hypothetical protein n=1 Tax=Kluyvera ascorbata TaxID=51288 RepID=UPI002AB965E8|nr:hypothetical protein [Kluyvera ascorbata]MDZ4029971.1 hypothetical protein [Kluyvera ascorbata]
MKSTYQMMNALVTLPPVGVSVKDGEGNTRKSGGELRARICAVVPGWCSPHLRYILPVPIVLSEFSRGGYSEKPWVAGEQIMVPDGYLIIAMLVDEKGKPLNDELLPVELEELPNNDWALNKSVPCCISSGEVFINNAFISAPTPKQPSADSSHTLSINIEGILKSALENAASAAAKQEEAMSDLRKLIDKSIEESIRLNCRPGGAIWQAIRRG